jgi:hypothetical protein
VAITCRPKSSLKSRGQNRQIQVAKVSEAMGYTRTYEPTEPSTRGESVFQLMLEVTCIRLVMQSPREIHERQPWRS